METGRERALELDRPSVWTGRASATVSINGWNTVSSTFDGSFGFTVYLVEETGSTAQDPRIPHDSVLGRIGGSFNSEISTDSEEVSGSGTISYFIGGTYDPGTEKIRIAISAAGMEATGKQTVLGRPEKGVPVSVMPISVNWNTGRRSAMDDAYEDIPKETIILKAPRPPAHLEHIGEKYLFNSVPQTGESEEQLITLDLHDPNPQTITHTYEDELSLGTRVTTWTITLVPIFTIERDDRGEDGAHSFVSTDSISLHVAIPGVTLADSAWASLISWSVTGQGPYAGNGIPSQGSQSSSFKFLPDPSNRPTSGSYVRNRPISYDVAATIEGTTQHYFLVQDEVDTLRQEYVDHKKSRIPSRQEFVPYPVDGRLNTGNYNLIIDDRLRLMLERITREFKQLPGATISVLGGYCSPQRGRVSDGHTGDDRVYGRSLELAPQPPNAETWDALRRACIAAGAECTFESLSGESMPLGPATRHLRATWKSLSDAEAARTSGGSTEAI